MPSQETIYDAHAREYDALVRAEDADGRLGPALRALLGDGRRVVEAGAGTGRLTALLGEHVSADGSRVDVLATDRSAAMLAIAAERAPFATLAVADARALPAPSGEADLGLAGWVFGHFRSWMPDGWRHEIGQAVDELERVVRPGRDVAILETLGTGTDGPGAPNPGLAEYYAWLEQQRGYARTVLQTDYRFADVDEAARICGFFFGEPLADRIRQRGWSRVPEWTGLWTKRVG